LARSSFSGITGDPAPCGDFRLTLVWDEKKPTVVMSVTYADLQGFYGGDGTRTDVRHAIEIRD